MAVLLPSLKSAEVLKLAYCLCQQAIGRFCILQVVPADLVCNRMQIKVTVVRVDRSFLRRIGVGDYAVLALGKAPSNILIIQIKTYICNRNVSEFPDLYL